MLDGDGVGSSNEGNGGTREGCQRKGKEPPKDVNGRLLSKPEGELFAVSEVGLEAGGEGKRA